VNAKGDDAGDCEKFAKYYRSLCPGEWVSGFVASCHYNISYCVLVKRIIIGFLIAICLFLLDFKIVKLAGSFSGCINLPFAIHPTMSLVINLYSAP
jgi:hypothetical protein